MNTKISVITICYNCKNDIEETILSVVNQTYPNVEYIVVDGGSYDGTMEIINKYRDKIDILISEPDNGIFDAMNKGIKHSTGIWVNFMNAGDKFYDLATLNDIFGNYDYFDVSVLYGNTFNDGSIQNPDKLEVLRHGGIMACHQSIFYNRELCGLEFYYKTKHKHYGDIELTTRLYVKKFAFQYIPITVANYKGGGFSSIVSTKARIAKFDYLYQNIGLVGIANGFWGKLVYLKQKYFN